MFYLKKVGCLRNLFGEIIYFGSFSYSSFHPPRKWTGAGIEWVLLSSLSLRFHLKELLLLLRTPTSRNVLITKYGNFGICLVK